MCLLLLLFLFTFYIFGFEGEVSNLTSDGGFVIKVKSGAAHHSCCVVVRNMQRCVYAIPTIPFLHNDTITELEKNVEESRNALVASKDTIAKQGRDGEKFQMPSIHLKDTISKLEKEVEESETALRTRLHVI